MNDPLEIIMAPFVLFFLAGGGALVVAVIIVLSFFRKSKSKAQYVKWSVVVVLSLGQAGCWKAMSNFDAAFGVHDGNNMVIIFLSIVSIWLIYQVALHLIRRRQHVVNEIGSSGEHNKEK